MLKKLRNNKKKGFTLVELIVVLVILAILAALLIPALTGYIDKAKEKQITAETRQVVMACQTLADEQYAKLDAGQTITGVSVSATEDAKTGVTGGTLTLAADDIKDLAEVDVSGTGALSLTVEPNGKIATLTYVEGNQQCVYTAANKEYVVSEH